MNLEMDQVLENLVGVRKMKIEFGNNHLYAHMEFSNIKKKYRCKNNWNAGIHIDVLAGSSHNEKP